MPSLSISFTSKRMVSTITRVLLAFTEITISMNASRTATRRNSITLSTIPAGVSP